MCIRDSFDIADDMKELEPAEKSFLQGDEFFTDEHLHWETLQQKLLSQGYSLEAVSYTHLEHFAYDLYQCHV